LTSTALQVEGTLADDVEMCDVYKWSQFTIQSHQIAENV